MNYLNLEGLGEVSVFDICQAHAQLEADYNNGGWVQERPSNLRRMEATSCQLSRLGYEDLYRWVDICAPDDENENDDNNVRHIYLANVLKWGLPIDAEMMSRIKELFAADYVAQFPQCAGEDYLQGR